MLKILWGLRGKCWTCYQKLEGRWSLLYNNRNHGWIVFYSCVEHRTFKQWTWILCWGGFQAKRWRCGLVFFLLLIIKYKRKEINWGRNLRKNEPAPCYLGNSQCIPIAKDAQLRKFIVRKMCSGEKSNYVTKSFAEEIGHVTHRSSQPSQQKPVIEMKLCRKDLWRTVLFNGVDSCDMLRRPKRFLKCCISRNTASLNWRG